MHQKSNLLQGHVLKSILLFLLMPYYTLEGQIKVALPILLFSYCLVSLWLHNTRVWMKVMLETCVDLSYTQLIF